MDKLELYKAYNTQREKFVYYLIALSVACIGFTVNATINISLMWNNDFLLLFAIVAWMLSIVFGFRYINKYLESFQILVIEIGRIEEKVRTKISTNENIDMDQIKLNLEEEISENNISMVKSKRGLEFFFYLGILFFLIWRIFFRVIL